METQTAKVVPSNPSNSVESIVKQADAIDVSSKVRLAEKFDEVFQKKLLKLQNMKFKTEEDLIQRFPFPDELVDEDGTYTWCDYIVLTQDIVPAIIAEEWTELPASTGRIKFNSLLKSKYIGISSPQVIKFLSENPDHQQWSQRRRSQRSRATVSSAPYKVIACDLAQLPPGVGGSYKYLFNLVDLWSKYAWSKPISRKSGPIVARELEIILKSLPAGAKLGVLRSDNGTEFKNPEVTAVLKKYGAGQVFSTPALPQSNGAIERFNATILTMLNSDLLGDKKVSSFAPSLKRALKTYNHSINTATGFFPSLLNSTTLAANVKAAVNQKLAQNAAGTQPNLRYQKPLVPGGKIRITLEQLDNSVKQAIKNHTYKASHHPTYSEQVFTVTKQDADNFVRVEGTSDKYPRGACLLIKTP
jgi:transposase InsO family protein